MVDRIGGYIINEEKLVRISKEIQKTKKILDKLKKFSNIKIDNIEIQRKHDDEYEENGENLIECLYIDAKQIPEMPDIIQDAIEKCKNVLICKVEKLSNELIEEAKGKYTENDIGGKND